LGLVVSYDQKAEVLRHPARRAVLRRTRRHGGYYGSDKVLLAELAWKIHEALAGADQAVGIV
jgi:hypothetical protein